MKKRITISVPENFTSNKSNEAIKAGIERRMASANPVAKRNRIIALVISVVLAISTMAVALAGGKPAGVKERAVMPEREITTWMLSDDERAAVEAAVMAVAGGESSLCQQAAAQAIRNTCEDYGMSVSQVLTEWQYPSNSNVSDDVKDAVSYVIDYKAVNERLHCFYNPAVQDGTWHESQTFVMQIGNVRFFS